VEERAALFQERDMSSEFAQHYGPWAVVAGASEGLGAEYARQLAARGIHVLLIARRAEVLSELGESIRSHHRVQVRTLALDLSDPSLAQRIRQATEDLTIGLVVCNAAHSTIGEFLTQELEQVLRTIDVNCRAPVILGHVLGKPMAARGRGGIVLMSSMSGEQGTPLIATYAATKAFNLVLAEGLWEELRHQGVDVVACRAGATRTPNYARSQPRGGDALLGDPGPVVRATLNALGRRSSVTPGLLNAFSAFFMNRVLPRRLAISVITRAMRKMYGP
jgi:short-subunit dehydrogenase